MSANLAAALDDMDPSGEWVNSLRERVNDALVGHPIGVSVTALIWELAEVLRTAPTEHRMAMTDAVCDAVQQLVRESLD